MELREVTSDNWREVIGIEPREDQGRFVASVAYYLNVCHYGEEWQPLAIYQGGEPVGFAMRGYEAEDDSYCIGGFVIDAGHQEKSYGGGGMKGLLDHPPRQPGDKEGPPPPQPENTGARPAPPG